LILALILLAVMTLAGMAAIYTSSQELRRSSNHRSTREAFYASEGAIEAVKNDGFYATTLTTVTFPAANHPTPAARDLTLGTTTANGTIRFVTSGNPPPGYGFSAKDSSASFFVIEAAGTSQAGVIDTQEELVARILPKSGG
jgi:hypothetical protein